MVVRYSLASIGFRWENGGSAGRDRIGEQLHDLQYKTLSLGGAQGYLGR